MAKKAAAPKKPVVAAKKTMPAVAAKAKKTITRQNTMEATATEGRALVARLDAISKKKSEEKSLKAAPAKAASAKAAPVKATSAKVAPAKLPASKAVSKGKAKASPKAVAAVPARSSATRSTRASGLLSAAPTAVSSKKSAKQAALARKKAPGPLPKKAVPAAPAKPVTGLFGSSSSSSAPAVSGGLFGTSSLFGSSPTYFNSGSQKDIDSCSKIAKTETVKIGKNGLQIIKKSLKSLAASTSSTASTDGVKKKSILRTKTGDRLAAGMVDVVFCCDTTSSMSSHLTQCLSSVKEIMKKIVDKTSGEGISVKFGFVAYRDHPPQDNSYLTCSYDLTSEEEILEFITSLSAQGGGDYPEAVFDGLHVAAKHMSWRDSTHIPSLRYIFHIADAPPHGKLYGSSSNDCLCGLDINKVSHIINMRQIHYRFIGTGSGTDKMVEVFKEKIVDFEQCTVAKAAEMDIRISDMIIRELLPDMVEEEQV